MATLKQILVVEDDEIIASLIERILQKKDYIVAGKVQTGEDAIRRAAEIQPDLVLMDIGLKGAIDGIYAARYINIVFNIPVIFLTGHYDDETIERAKVAEPLGFITKPFNDKDIYSSVEIALYNAAMMRRLFKSRETNLKSIMTMLDAVILTDMKGRIFFMNPYAEQLVNVPYRSAMLHSINRLFYLIDVRTNQPVSDPVMEVIKESMVIGIENNLAMITNDQKKRYVTLVARPLKDNTDEVIAALVVIHVMSPTERRLFTQ
ncbi:MAG TPA: response regulator [Methanoregulaceae archaeon]|nr:response regulator [Methanoregulaceae archaeon]